ncbi:hypothetical protein U0070_016988 [Myodes glareolus]|uniref:N-terminal Ras-GEF domain-containing protein n=1 Tax=Myodes glareolus TaxID=447135 RepID=A0AAW0IFW4_MYOGA
MPVLRNQPKTWHRLDKYFPIKPQPQTINVNRILDADGNLCRSNQLLQVVLTMHRIIISSAELLQKLMSLYPWAPT